MNELTILIPVSINSVDLVFEDSHENDFVIDNPIIPNTK